MNTSVQSGQGSGRQRDVCKYCGKPIATKKISTTSGECFHPEHFLCSTCNKALSTDKHYLADGKYYCPTCWESHCPCCGLCGQPIVTGAKIEAMGKVWHPEHFRCSKCECLLSSSFSIVDGRPFCPEHAHGFAPTLVCTRCGKAITSGQYFNNKDNTRHWHSDCFTCASCKMPFPGGNHYEVDGEVYCQLHYHATKGSICAACGLPVVGEGLEANDAVWFVPFSLFLLRVLCA